MNKMWVKSEKKVKNEKVKRSENSLQKQIETLENQISKKGEKIKKQCFIDTFGKVHPKD